jgi:hypothetical protein
MEINFKHLINNFLLKLFNFLINSIQLIKNSKLNLKFLSYLVFYYKTNLFFLIFLIY